MMCVTAIKRDVPVSMRACMCRVTRFVKYYHTWRAYILLCCYILYFNIMLLTTPFRDAHTTLRRHASHAGRPRCVSVVYTTPVRRVSNFHATDTHNNNNNINLCYILYNNNYDVILWPPANISGYQEFRDRRPIDAIIFTHAMSRAHYYIGIKTRIIEAIYDLTAAVVIRITVLLYNIRSAKARIPPETIISNRRGIHRT